MRSPRTKPLRRVTPFAIPVYDDAGELARYNVFKARILVRHAKDGKLYLYDILRTKADASLPYPGEHAGGEPMRGGHINLGMESRHYL